ncbi:MAG: type II secretion system protein [Pseudomonadota bacterium]
MIESRARYHKARGEDGFSLLETLVAVAILGIALVPLLSFQSQLARNAIQIDRSTERLSVENVALSYLALIKDPTQPPQPIDMGGGWTLNWTARAVSQSDRAVAGTGARGRFEMQLYTVVGLAEHTDYPSVEAETLVLLERELFPFLR